VTPVVWPLACSIKNGPLMHDVSMKIGICQGHQPHCIPFIITLKIGLVPYFRDQIRV
jgi:hypothetical protein